MQALPPNIQNLPTYVVSNELFISTIIIMVIFLIMGISLTLAWIYRSNKHIYNYEYIPYHEFKYYREKKIQEIKVEDQEVLNQQGFTESQESVYNPEHERKYRNYNRNQSRILEFICLSVVVIININAYASQVYLIVIAFVLALISFVIFNLFRVKEDRSFFRYIFYIFLLIAYVPFFLNKSLTA